MKQIFFLLLFISLMGCQSKSKKTAPEKKQYLADLYFRYVADIQESMIEFTPVEKQKDGQQKPAKFNAGVFYNGGTMEEKQPGKNLPLKYVVKRENEFPTQIELKIDHILDFATAPPMLKNFSAKKDGQKVTINTPTPLDEQDQIILVFFDSNGKDYTAKLVGRIAMPHVITLPDHVLTEPMSLSAIYQKRFPYTTDQFTMNVLLEYYSADIAL
ncbi:MAG TPA: hypothetical protein ENK85_03860 [Saprospiraceae bacterium]|nr:hypothetical protein [Saprospiraceae bacterium]